MATKSTQQYCKVALEVTFPLTALYKLSSYAALPI